MEFEQLSKHYQERFQSLQESITDLLKQLFSRDLQVELKGTEALKSSASVQEDGTPEVQIQFSTKGRRDYHHTLAFSSETGLKIFAWLTQKETDESLNDEHLQGLTEGSNQVLEQLQTALEGDPEAFKVEGLQARINEAQEENSDDEEGQSGLAATYELTSGEETVVVRHHVWLTNEEQLEGEEEQLSEADQPAEGETPPQEDQASEISESGEESSGELVGVHPVDFESLEENGPTNGKPRNLDMLYDVGLEVLVELGKKSMVIQDILKLGKGSIIELEKAAGDPLEIFVNGRKLAEGEVVVVDDHFGIRITQLAGPKQRIQNLI